MSFDVMFFAPDADRDAPLDAATSRSLAGVVQQHGGPGAPDEYGYFFELNDGGGVEFYAGHRVGGMLALRDLTPELCDFIFDVMAATGWVAAFQFEETTLLTARELTPAELRRVEGPDAKIVLVRSPDDVARALADAFGGWEAYRDHVNETLKPK
jgi:hypothetical protein